MHENVACGTEQGMHVSAVVSTLEARFHSSGLREQALGTEAKAHTFLSVANQGHPLHGRFDRGCARAVEVNLARV